MDILYLLAALAAIVALQALLIGKFALRGLTYTRAFSKEAAFPGDTVEMVEVLRNAKPLPLPWVRAESRMSTSLQFAAQAQDGGLHEIGEDALFHRSAFFLAPFSQVTRRHEVRLQKRGRYAVGTVALTASDLFGMTQQAASLDTGATITVYPRLLDASALGIPSSRWQGDVAVQRWIIPDPFLIAGIREAQPGDPLRDVHWAASARTGRLQVKAHDHTASPRLLVVLNVQRAEDQWGNLMDYEQGVIEHGIEIAATLCHRALAEGVEAGFCANAPIQGLPEGEPTVLLPARYAGREEDLLEAMARLRILRARNFYTFLEELGTVTGLDIVVLSAYDSEKIEAGLAMLRHAGNSVAFVPLGEAVS